MDSSLIFEVCINDIFIKQFSRKSVNTYFIDNGFKKISNSTGTNEYWSDFWSLLAKYPLESRTEYTDEEFGEALELYRNQEIQQSINSSNPLVRMFSVLDKRIGKKTIAKLRETIAEQPEWLQKFYTLILPY